MNTTELTPERILRLEAGAVVVLDQRRLPDEEVELRCDSAAAVALGSAPGTGGAGSSVPIEGSPPAQPLVVRANRRVRVGIQRRMP